MAKLTKEPAPGCELGRIGKQDRRASRLDEGAHSKESPHADKPSVESARATARTPIKPPRPAASARTTRSSTKTPRSGRGPGRRVLGFRAYPQRRQFFHKGCEFCLKKGKERFAYPI